MATTQTPQEPVVATPQQPTSPVDAAAPQQVPAPTENQFHSASLYVGDLHPDVTEALLFDIFNAVGPVASIRVCRDAVTRRSLGYAYVNFHNLTDAERALDTMNYTLIKGRPCRMMWSQRDPSLRKTGAGNVFVKNLHPSIDNKALYDTFSLFGNILSCKVVTDKSGKSKGYGFVHFEGVEAAEDAIRKINGMLIEDKEVFVGQFVKRNERPGNDNWTNIYIKNLPLSWDLDSFQDFFGDAGAIASAVIMKDPTTGKSKGFGFVDFVEHEGAASAVGLFDNFIIEDAEGEIITERKPKKADSTEDDKTEETSTDEAEKTEDAAEKTAESTDDKKEEDEPTAAAEESEEQPTGKRGYRLAVCRAQKKNERERELSQKFEALKMERVNKYQGVNLYVRNLAEDVDDDVLRKEFSHVGAITSARIMRDQVVLEDGRKEVGPSKGFGFVCFSTTEEATKAVTEMNGKMVNGKPIFVALAQRKDARRAQLEQQHSNRGPRGMPMQPAMYPGAAQMFYAQGGMPQQARPNFGYMPQQMMPRGMMPGQPQGMPGGYPRGFPLQQQQGFMPQQGMQGGPRGAPGGARRGRGGGPGAGGRGPANMQGNNNNNQFKYTNNARNQPAMPMAQGNNNAAPPQMDQNQQQQASQAPPAQPSLTAAMLANASDAQQKDMIGERLYPLIVSAVKPELAGKITGMLLEMDNPELLHLLESNTALLAKINEALRVLDAHQSHATE